MDFRRNLEPFAARRAGALGLALVLCSSPAFAAGGVVIDIDASIVIQFALILFLWATLNKLVFQPYLATAQARQARTEDTRLEAQRLSERARALANEHQNRWTVARDSAASARNALRDAGAVRREAALVAARSEGREAMDDARVSIDAQVLAARAELNIRATEVAQAVVEKILGRGL